MHFNIIIIIIIIIIIVIRFVRCPIRMSLSFPRLADIAAVKSAACLLLAKQQPELAPLSPEHVAAVELAVSSHSSKGISYGEIIRFLDDKIPLANIVAETLNANSSSPVSPSSSPAMVSSSGAHELTLMLTENCKHLGYVASLSMSRLENALATPASTAVLPHMGSYEDHLEYAFPDLSEGDLVVDIDDVKRSTPLAFADLVVGSRIDALDHRGQW